MVLWGKNNKIDKALQRLTKKKLAKTKLPISRMKILQSSKRKSHVLYQKKKKKNPRTTK